MADEENVLGRIPAEFMGDISAFPPAETCKGQFREIVVDVTVHGFKARIRYEPKENRGTRTKHRYWYWHAVSAVKVD
jgi:hypothetical protein